jgi:hypothetical protein
MRQGQKGRRGTSRCRRKRKVSIFQHSYEAARERKRTPAWPARPLKKGKNRSCHDIKLVTIRNSGLLERHNWLYKPTEMAPGTHFWIPGL